MPRLLPFDLAQPQRSLSAVEAAVQASDDPLLLYFTGCDRGVDRQLLHWVTLCFDAVAKNHPQLDMVPLVPAAGWSAEQVAALPGLETVLADAATQPAACECLQQLNTLRSSMGAECTPLQLQVLPGAGGSVGGGKEAPPAAAVLDNATTVDDGDLGDRLAVQLMDGGGGGTLCYDRVVVGGTFDRLHAGHRLLLAVTALVAACEVWVGITDAAMIASKKRRELLQSYEARAERVAGYMHAVRPGLAVHPTPLTDAKEPTPASLVPQLQAIVVSQETIQGAQHINDDRAARGFAPLAIVVVELVGLRKGAHTSEKLSSTQLREADATAQQVSKVQ